MSAPPLGLVARATISSVVDGDTVRVLCLGLPMTVRLRACWSPEVNRGSEEERAAGQAAKEYMEKLAKPGDACVIQVPTAGADSLADVFSFGRVIGDIWVDPKSLSLGQRMVCSGHAKAEK